MQGRASKEAGSNGSAKEEACKQHAGKQSMQTERKGRGRRKEATERERERKKERKGDKEKERKRKRERVRERRSEGAKGDRVA